MARALAIFGLLIIVLFAGCTGGGQKVVQSPPSVAPSATVTADTGAIEGVVVNDEELPLAGADVGLVETLAEAKSDAEGRFTFSELAPGTYNLVVERLGYTSFARKVEVLAGESTFVTISMVPIAIAEPYMEGPYIFKGYNQAGWSVLDIFTSDTGTAGCQKCVMQFNMSATVVEAVFELSIQPTIPDPTGGKHMYVQAYLTNDGTSLGTTVANDEWSDGDVWRWSKESRLPGGEGDFPANQPSRVIWSNFCPVLWVCADQTFEVHYAFFHLAPGPEDFALVPR